MKNLSATVKALVLASTTVILFVGCKKNEPDLDPQTGYFGLEEKRFVEYDVTYIFHDNMLQKHDTVHYQIRTEVADTVHDNAGRVARKFYRYIRPNASAAWQVKDLWTGIINGSNAEMVEENQRLVKLVFRPSEDKEWDINAFNNLGEMKAHYSSVGAAKTFGALSFPATVTVEQEDYKTLIDLRRKYEVYANGVGMVYKESRDLKYAFGEATPIKGEEYFYSVINYGLE